MFKSAAIALAWKVLEVMLIKRLQKGSPWREYLEGQIGHAKKVSSILTDKNPDDAAQLQELWEENQKDIYDDHLELIEDLCESGQVTGVVGEMSYELAKALREQLGVPDTRPGSLSG